MSSALFLPFILPYILPSPTGCWGGGADVVAVGKTATLKWYSAPSSAEIHVQVNGADITNLQITGSSYSNN